MQGWSHAMESSLILDKTVATDILDMNMISTSLENTNHVTGMVQCVITMEGLWFIWCDFKFQHNIHSSLMGHGK
jgi:hypothetical protein